MVEGIVSYGAYVPAYRLTAQVVNGMWGGAGKGERAIANWDEDSITMAVEAGRDCLRGLERESIDALYFASSTSPYKEKQSASIVAAALDLRQDIQSADFAGSLRSGTVALAAALSAVKSGAARNVLVCVADCRMPAPNSAFELLFGDGAAAFLVGRDGVIVELVCSSWLSSEFIDVWRLDSDRFTRTWEDRFNIEEGYEKHLVQATHSLLEKSGLTAKDFARAALYAPDVRSHANMARSIGLDPKTQLQNPLFDRLGNTGTAFALMLLVGALENAKPGELLLLANYGDGADAHVLRVTPEMAKVKDRKRLERHLISRLVLNNYGKYVKFRGLMEFEQTPGYRQRTSLPMIWRDRKWVYRFHGHKCTKCDKVQFPMQKFCIYCQAPAAQMEEVRLAERTGTIVTFSMDERAPVVDPPTVLMAVSLEGGGRIFSELTDRDPAEVKVGMRVEMTFRKINDALGVHNYFWKCRPIRVRKD